MVIRTAACICASMFWVVGAVGATGAMGATGATGAMGAVGATGAVGCILAVLDCVTVTPGVATVTAGVGVTGAGCNPKAIFLLPNDDWIDLNSSSFRSIVFLLNLPQMGASWFLTC